MQVNAYPIQKGLRGTEAVICRKMEARDIRQIKELHAKQGFDYQLPNFLGNNILAKRVLDDGTGRVVMSVAARVTVEIYMQVDEDWETPGQRFYGLKLLHESMRRELAEKGIEDCHAWLPPQVENFGRRLTKQFGWLRNTWPNFVRFING